jgi:hypothetical protein
VLAAGRGGRFGNGESAQGFGLAGQACRAPPGWSAAGSFRLCYRVLITGWVAHRCVSLQAYFQVCFTTHARKSSEISLACSRVAWFVLLFSGVYQHVCFRSTLTLTHPDTHRDTHADTPDTHTCLHPSIHTCIRAEGVDKKISFLHHGRCPPRGIFLSACLPVHLSTYL